MTKKLFAFDDSLANDALDKLTAYNTVFVDVLKADDEHDISAMLLELREAHEQLLVFHLTLIVRLNLEISEDDDGETN